MISAMIIKEGIIFLRYPTRILSAVVFPLFLTLIFAFTQELFSEGESISSSNLFVGMSIFLIISIASEAPTRIVEEQQQGTLEAIFLTPAVRYSTVLGVLFVRFLFMIATVLLYYVVILFSFGKSNIIHPFIALFYIILVVLQAFGYGIFMSGVTITAKETGLRASVFVPYIVIIFSGVFVSISVLPTPWIWISLLIPLSYTVDSIYSAVGDAVYGSSTLIPAFYEFLISILFTSFLILFGIRYYISKVNAASKNGSLLEY